MKQLPIHDGGASCGLDERGAARRNAEFAEVVEYGLRARQRIAGRVRLIFQRKNGLEEDIRELVRRESQCCGFFAFDVTVGEDDILVEVTAPPDKMAYLDALYRATDPPRRTGSAAPSQTGPANNEGDSRNE